MKITALVENYTNCELKAKHGLSLYIETRKHKILFDLGPDDTLFVNAKKRKIDLLAVDTVIISHGHGDHGGALKRFLEINNKAKIYIQRNAFDKYYSKVFFLRIKIGLNQNLRTHPQIILLDGNYQIDKELTLFTVSKTNRCYSPANDVLYRKNEKDTFNHEQNLIIEENKTALIMGCGHAGVVNILNAATKYNPDLCVGGYHLYNPFTKKTVATSLLKEIAQELQKYKTIKFYTCHCTGKEAFQVLSNELLNLSYLSCGEVFNCNYIY